MCTAFVWLLFTQHNVCETYLVVRVSVTHSPLLQSATPLVDVLQFLSHLPDGLCSCFQSWATVGNAFVNALGLTFMWKSNNILVNVSVYIKL